jgi:hypothetical protein
MAELYRQVAEGSEVGSGERLQIQGLGKKKDTESSPTRPSHSSHDGRLKRFAARCVLRIGNPSGWCASHPRSSGNVFESLDESRAVATMSDSSVAGVRRRAAEIRTSLHDLRGTTGRQRCDYAHRLRLRRRKLPTHL